MDFLSMCCQVSFQSESLVADITNLRFYALVNTEDVPFQIFGKDEGFRTLIALVFPHTIMGLANVSVKVPLIGDPTGTLWTLDAFAVDTSIMSLKTSVGGV